MIAKAAKLWIDLVRDRRAVAAVEFALTLPLLITMTLGAVVFFDYFRNQQALERAVFTSGDILTRRQDGEAWTQSDIELHQQLIARLVPRESIDPSYRVTSVERQDDENVVLWQADAGPQWQGQDLTALLIPDMADGDTVLVVQSHTPFTPLFNFDAFSLTALENAAVYRPRFANRIRYAP